MKSFARLSILGKDELSLSGKWIISWRLKFFIFISSSPSSFSSSPSMQRNQSCVLRLCNIGKREIDAYKNVKKMSLSARCRGQGNNCTRGEKRRTSNWEFPPPFVRSRPTIDRCRFPFLLRNRSRMYNDFDPKMCKEKDRRRVCCRNFRRCLSKKKFVRNVYNS